MSVGAQRILSTSKQIRWGEAETNEASRHARLSLATEKVFLQDDPCACGCAAAVGRVKAYLDTTRRSDLLPVQGGVSIYLSV